MIDEILDFIGDLLDGFGSGRSSRLSRRPKRGRRWLRRTFTRSKCGCPCGSCRTYCGACTRGCD